MKRTLSVLIALAFVLTALQVQPAAAQTTTYTVKSGDNLYQIALKYGTTVEAIMQANGLTSTIIIVGQVLIIPTGGAAPPTATHSTGLAISSSSSLAAFFGGGAAAGVGSSGRSDAISSSTSARLSAAGSSCR